MVLPKHPSKSHTAVSNEGHSRPPKNSPPTEVNSKDVSLVAEPRNKGGFKKGLMELFQNMTFNRGGSAEKSLDEQIKYGGLDLIDHNKSRSFSRLDMSTVKEKPQKILKDKSLPQLRRIPKPTVTWKIKEVINIRELRAKAEKQKAFGSKMKNFTLDERTKKHYEKIFAEKADPDILDPILGLRDHQSLEVSHVLGTQDKKAADRSTKVTLLKESEFSSGEKIHPLKKLSMMPSYDFGSTKGSHFFTMSPSIVKDKEFSRMHKMNPPNSDLETTFVQSPIKKPKAIDSEKGSIKETEISVGDSRKPTRNGLSRFRGKSIGNLRSQDSLLNAQESQLALLISLKKIPLLDVTEANLFSVCNRVCFLMNICIEKEVQRNVIFSILHDIEGEEGSELFKVFGNYAIKTKLKYDELDLFRTCKTGYIKANQITAQNTTADISMSQSSGMRIQNRKNFYVKLTSLLSKLSIYVRGIKREMLEHQVSLINTMLEHQFAQKPLIVLDDPLKLKQNLFYQKDSLLEPKSIVNSFVGHEHRQSVLDLTKNFMTGGKEVKMNHVNPEIVKQNSMAHAISANIPKEYHGREEKRMARRQKLKPGQMRSRSLMN